MLGANRCAAFGVVRPPGIEAFLPISSLISLKYWLVTGIINPVHPAGLIIFLMALVTAVVLTTLVLVSHGPLQPIRILIVCVLAVGLEQLSRWGIDNLSVPIVATVAATLMAFLLGVPV